MPSTTSTVAMLLFCATLGSTYVVARLGRVPAGVLWAGGIVVNSLVFCLYTLTRQLVLADALVAGLFLGLIFTSGSILLGQFFRQVNVATRENAHSGCFPNAEACDVSVAIYQQSMTPAGFPGFEWICDLTCHPPRGRHSRLTVRVPCGSYSTARSRVWT
jgi:hypothetical protein